ncbi:hypothetical protein CJO80_16670 [Ralstonia solanacearum]|nr:hypothetical protein CJO80_16670 [Ralstonia solanacearum]
MERIFPVEEVLFVFGKWTLMMDSVRCAGLEVGATVDLLDEAGQRLGDAVIGAFLKTQNPTIQPIELVRGAADGDVRRVRMVRLRGV